MCCYKCTCTVVLDLGLGECRGEEERGMVASLSVDLLGEEKRGRVTSESLCKVERQESVDF